MSYPTCQDRRVEATANVWSSVFLLRNSKSTLCESWEMSTQIVTFVIGTTMAVSTASVPCLQACEAVEQMAHDIIHMGRAIIRHSPTSIWRCLKSVLQWQPRSSRQHRCMFQTFFSAALQNVPWQIGFRFMDACDGQAWKLGNSSGVVWYWSSNHGTVAPGWLGNVGTTDVDLSFLWTLLRAKTRLNKYLAVEWKKISRRGHNH